jgi:hypothetical protein
MSTGVFVIRRLKDDMQFSAGGEEFKVRYIWQSLRDWKTYVASTCILPFLVISTECTQWGYIWDCGSENHNLPLALIHQ